MTKALQVRTGADLVEGWLSIVDDQGRRVATVRAEEARVLAAAPALLDLVERLARVAGGVGFGCDAVREAEEMIGRLREVA